MSRVAVILTSYNRPSMVQKTVNSVLNQIWGDFTLYIMDDNSVEQVKDILRRYTQDTRVKLFFSDVKNEDRLKSCRYAVLINQALKMGSEQFVTYLTDDAGMYPNKLYDMVYWFDHYLDLNVCYGNQHVIQNGKVIGTRGNYGIVTNPSGILDHSQIMFRRKILENVGYWSEDASHPGDKDAVWFYAVSQRGYRFYPVEKVTDWLIWHGKMFGHTVRSGRQAEILDGSLRE